MGKIIRFYCFSFSLLSFLVCPLFVFASEIGDKIAKCKTFHDVFNVIVDYMDYYNNHRYQWDLAKLAPAEYYEYYMTGIYLLPKGNDKNQNNV